LVAHGIVPNVVVGTSIGAVVAAPTPPGIWTPWKKDGPQPASAPTFFGYSTLRLNGSGLIGGDSSPQTRISPRSGQH